MLQQRRCASDSDGEWKSGGDDGARTNGFCVTKQTCKCQINHISHIVLYSAAYILCSVARREHSLHAFRAFGPKRDFTVLWNGKRHAAAGGKDDRWEIRRVSFHLAERVWREQFAFYLRLLTKLSLTTTSDACGCVCLVQTSVTVTRYKLAAIRHHRHATHITR